MHAAQLAQVEAASEPDALDLPVESCTLPNGLKVVLHVDRRLPIVHVNSWYHVGSKDERPGRTGLAHLCEHLMFKGSKHAKGRYMNRIQQAGANLAEGGVNATTNNDRTNFFATVPPSSLERVLWLESDRLANLTAALSRRKLNRERDVVDNERRQRVDARAYGRVDRLLVQNLFPPAHPYSHDVLGSAEDLAAMRLDAVKAFFDTYYVPNNLSLAITGDIDPAQALRLVEKYYGTIQPGPPLERFRRWIPAIGEVRVFETRDTAPQERTYFAWPSPPLFDRYDAELDLASQILAQGRASRLARSLIHDRQLCSDVGSLQKSMEIAGMFLVWATLRPDASLVDVERVMVDEISRLAVDGPGAAELRRAVVNFERQYISHLDRIGGFGGKADLLNMYNTYLDHPAGFAADLTRYRTATPEGVRDAVRKWADPSSRLVLRFRPDHAARSVMPEIDRVKAPVIRAESRFIPPRVDRSTLSNGMDVLVVERRDLPQVVGVLATRAGSIHDPPGKEGLASLALHTMACGTREMSAREIDERLGFAGATLDAATHTEHSTMRFAVVPEHLPAALETLAELVRHPSFPALEVCTEQGKRVDQLQQLAAQSWAIAMRVSTSLFFGAAHPYGRPPQGRPSTLASVTPDDLARFHAAHWSASGSALVLVGDISLAEAVSLATDGFGSWPGVARPDAVIGAPRTWAGGRICVVDRPGATQTVAAGVLPGPARSDPDYYALTLANAVWGGSATGRLVKNLRDRKGYSYGVRSFVISHAQHGVWKFAGHVQGNKTIAALNEVRRELSCIAGDKPVTAAELAAAKRQWISGYAQHFEGSSRIAQEVAKLWAARLPLAELRNEPDCIQAATTMDVNGAAQKYATPGAAGLLLVGDLRTIEAEAGRGELDDFVILDTEGEPLREPETV